MFLLIKTESKAWALSSLFLFTLMVKKQEKYSDRTDDELKCVLPAFCYLLERAKKVVEDIIVIINTDLKEEIVNGFTQACEKNNVKCLHLNEIDKENGHPTELGMRQISEQVAKTLI